MRFMVYEQIWHGFDVLHCHLLLMMDFDCLLAFRHKKGEYILRALCFCFQEESIFLLVGACGVVWIVSRCFILYFYFFSACHICFVLLGYS